MPAVNTNSAQTAPAVTIQVVRKADLLAGDVGKDWDDPDVIARLTPQKRQTLIDNPLSGSDQDPVQLIGLQGNRVIGRLDLITGRIDTEAGPVPIIWTSAYFVPEQARRTLMGVTLILKMQQLAQTVGACSVSQMALPVLEKLKWSKFTLPRYLLLRRSRSVVQRYLGVNWRSSIATRLADVVLLVHRALVAGTSKFTLRGLRAEQVDSASPELDEKLRHRDTPAGPHRSAALINWMLNHGFDDDPRIRKGLFYIYDSQHRLLGYFMIRMKFFAVASHRGFRNLMLGSLGDWRIFEPADLDVRRLVLLAMQTLGKWNPDAIEICVADKALGKYFRRRGLLRLGELAILIKTAPQSPLRLEMYRDQANWQLTPAEGDNFFA